MEIYEALDATGCAHSAAQLAGVDPKTVRRYARMRDTGQPSDAPVMRPKLIDPFLPKIEEWVERSQGKARADKLHERLVLLGFTGDERTTRRAVAVAKGRWEAGHRRTYRPWITEPGLWVQFDWGWGPKVPGPGGGAPRVTLLFCAWLAWSRFRVVIPVWDRTLPTLISCVDSMLRAIGGVPTYALTDNEKTVTIDRVAGVAVRHPQIVAAGRHYGLQVHTCVPFDPESKGGSEATVRVAKADLVPTDANLRPAYDSFAELRGACAIFCQQVNNRVHRETGRAPSTMLDIERTRLHALPAGPHTLALGESRQVLRDQTVRFGSVRYSTPPGLVGQEAWVRVDGDELVVVCDLSQLAHRPEWMQGPAGLAEVARHQIALPGRPVIDTAHYPDHPQEMDGSPRPPKVKPGNDAEEAFLALGPGAKSWLIEAAAAGTTRIRVKMAGAVELAALVGTAEVDLSLGLAAINRRFAEGDLMSIVQHRKEAARPADLVVADEAHSAQPGTGAWSDFGRPAT
ncbi:IS21 family transposase [Streptomyces sp. H27-S2]|uniref:IS21 family transposase n=1 Tax=Streptomyces antarcticus TaxID=2996458 RepID=UPI00226F410E|nr:IS21 family transposase [Streptomyces sp. H27-S2]MCY0949469.1 IS21 family transposase [Streptomyces sp. H27-S2]